MSTSRGAPTRRGVLVCAALAALGAARIAQGTVLVNGAGATLPAGLYARWFGEYGKGHADFKFDYQAVGSGAGLEQMALRAVDFAASDAPMTDEQIENSPAVVHVPVALYAVAVVYTLNAAPGVTLRLGSTVLADIFLGRIANWSDPRIAAENQGVRLPDLPIIIVYRADRSGSTQVFTDYLTKVSPEWRDKVGASMNPPWPLGLGIKGANNALGLIRGTNGAIGYAEFSSATRLRMNVAALGNSSGSFVLPTAASTSAAASSASQSPSLRMLLTNMPGADAYPLTAFTYLLLPPDQGDAQRGKALLSFLWWSLHEGQQFAALHGLMPLPRAVVTRVETTLRGLKVLGRPVPLGG